METKETRAKLNGVLQAIASGHSCEQILAADRTLSYHHIFHAIAEAPTSFWDKPSAQTPGKAGPRSKTAPRSAARQRAD